MGLVTRYLRARFVLVSTVVLAVVIGGSLDVALDALGVRVAHGLSLVVGFVLAVCLGFAALAGVASVRSGEN